MSKRLNYKKDNFSTEKNKIILHSCTNLNLMVWEFLFYY